MSIGGRFLGIALVLLGMAACSSSTSPDGGSGADGPSLDAASAQLTCAQARDAWLARMAMVDDTCNDQAPCATIGGDSAPTCTTVSSVSQTCYGVAARGTAIAAAQSELDELAAAWQTACAGTSCGNPGKTCLPDCGPGVVACVQGHCVVNPAVCPNACGCAPSIDAGT
jgi:hypothetical protein